MERIYLVTGAAGHLGSNIVSMLLKEKIKVRALVLPNDKIETNDKNLEVFYGDVRDKESLNSFFNDLENKDSVCIHCAGIVSIASKYNQNVYDVNVVGTKNIMDLCFEKEIKRVIYVSSVHAIKETKGVIKETKEFNKDEVKGLYAKTKAEATSYVLEMAQKGLNVSVVHPSGIIGPNDKGNGHITQLIIDYTNKKLVAGVKGGYDFVDVRDVAKGILNCVYLGKKGECYILSNKYYKVSEILNILHDITGVKKIRSIIPMWIAKVTAPLSELYYKIKKQTPLYTAYSLYTLESNACFSSSKARQELNYSTRPIEETLKDTYLYLKENNRLK